MSSTVDPARLACRGIKNPIQRRHIGLLGMVRGAERATQARDDLFQTARRYRRLGLTAPARIFAERARETQRIIGRWTPQSVIRKP